MVEWHRLWQWATGFRPRMVGRPLSMRSELLLRAALAGALLAVVAAPASAQIVYDQGSSQITVANDDGSAAKPLITVDQVSGMEGVEAPAVNPSGTTVVFEGMDPFTDYRAAGACGSDCTGVYKYSDGTIRRVSGRGPSCTYPCALIEEQPEIGSNGKIVSSYEWATWDSFWTGSGYIWSIDSSHSWSALTTPPHGDPVEGASPNEIASYCGGHNISYPPAYPGIS